MQRPFTRWLVTGGAGFIGSHFVDLLLGLPGTERVWVLDLLAYAGRREHLSAALRDPRCELRVGDVAEPDTIEALLRELRPQVVVNFAAESHVDRSIADAAPFLRTNLGGVHALLEAWRRRPGWRLVQVSTDEVYGEVEAPRRAREGDPLRPSNPYAASKAAAELLLGAYRRTYGVDAVVTRGCNTLGPRQHPEKLLPLLVERALRGEPLPLYGDGRQEREWLAVEDHCRGVLAAALRGRPGRAYNLGSGELRENRWMARRLLELLEGAGLLPPGPPLEERIARVEDRPGHDRRYALDSGQAARELGWRARVPLERALERTVLALARELGPARR